MKCSDLLSFEDDEEGLFVYLCKYNHLIITFSALIKIIFELTHASCGSR